MRNVMYGHARGNTPSVKRPSWIQFKASTIPHTGGRTVAANAAIVAVAYAVSRVLGMVREIVIAARFGTGETYDAYLAAFRIPDMLFVVVMSGAFGAAFIPVFGGFLAREDADRAWRLANALLTWTVVILLVVAQVLFLTAGPLVTRIIAPDLPPDAQDLAVNLTRLLLLSPLLLGIGAAARGMLEAQDRFTLPAIAPIVYNLGSIAGALFLAPGMGIYGLVTGVLLGAAGHAAIQLGWLLRNGLTLRPVFDPATPGLREVGRLAGPRLLGQFVGQSNLIVVTSITSGAGAGAGAISAIFYAQHLVLLPHGILAMSLSTVIFPRMARQFELGQRDVLRDTLVRAMRSRTFLTLPAIVVLIVLRESIVQVVYQYGAFSEESTSLVVESLLWLAPGLLARSLIEPLTRGFYAMHDTVTPLVVATGAVALNAALAVVLFDRAGLAGIAASLSIAYTARMVALLLVLSRRTDGLTRWSTPFLLRMTVPGVVLAGASMVAAHPLAHLTDPASGRSVWGYLVFAFALAALGAAYLGQAWLLRLPEAVTVADRLVRKGR